MNKNKETLQARRQFIADQITIRKHEKVETVVRRVANQLFLSEATIWQDLKAATKKRD